MVHHQAKKTNKAQVHPQPMDSLANQVHQAHPVPLAPLHHVSPVRRVRTVSQQRRVNTVNQVRLTVSLERRISTLNLGDR